ncbi:MAG TPA: homoserine kinase [Rhodanobacteraceae bacterium]
MSAHVQQATAFAPGSVGNIGVGFDVLGHSVGCVGDTATVRRIDTPDVRIAAITGCVTQLPTEAARNTAGASLLSFRRALKLPFGLELTLAKGIPLGSGMGGSAASCVAALLAANALLDKPLTPRELYAFAMDGEAVASGGRHGDNLGSMLLGGVVMATPDRLERIDVPDAWHVALVHPHMVLETRKSRAALVGDYALKEFVAQSTNLAQVLVGCFKGDADLVRAGLSDVLIEPRRAPLIPGFAAVKQAALDHGAMGASISGGGPSVFGWFETRAQAQAAVGAMVAAFAAVGLDADPYVAPVNGPAAHLVTSRSVSTATL